MKRLLLIFFIGVLSCKNDASKVVNDFSTTASKEAVVLDPQSKIDLKVYDYDGLEPLINKTDNKVHVVNFWATWCAPCIKELPYFEEVNQKYKDKNVEVLLVSLDFPRQYDSKLKPFIEKNDIQSEVVALDDTDMNRWVALVNENWTGAIPATIIYNNKKRQFYERSFTQKELETELEQFIN
ncbi:TlpA disulfide reductase family protein [Winogradskyella sp.]|uniref:TlpA family protein disulfide reductase n=1 Tax=Winogradskyella sp. TaxID=1883156 RepID=UPI0026221E36|nr:TlpA disulfide reductase family protein [Winogradskyella sp.]